MHISWVTLVALTSLFSVSVSCARDSRPECPASQGATPVAAADDGSSPEAGSAAVTPPTGEAHASGDDHPASDASASDASASDASATAGAPVGGGARPIADAPATEGAPTAGDVAASGRLSRAQIDAYGPAGDSVCRAHKVASGAKVGGCSVVGPYPGIIDGGAKSPDFERYEEALDACASAPTCIGVSSSWYTGSPWFFVDGAAKFAVDDDSYGCTLLLDCPPDPS